MPMINKSHRIGVLLGGRSAEREISLKSGAAISEALRQRGYWVKEFDPSIEGFINDLSAANIDAAFLALHGRGGEDGSIQGLLEQMEIPYTGSGILASALAINKIMTKRVIESAGLPTAPYLTISKAEYRLNTDYALQRLRQQIETDLGWPLVIKAPTQGSSIGIIFVNDYSELKDALEQCFEYDDELLIEKKISGMEVTAPVWDINDKPQTIALIEIVAEIGEYYDYASKYQKGGSTHIIPPDLSDDLRIIISELAEQCYSVLNCRGVARVDFLVDLNDRKPYILEVNTIPGMTSTSLVPDACRSIGIEFPDMCELLLRKILPE